MPKNFVYQLRSQRNYFKCFKVHFFNTAFGQHSLMSGAAMLKSGTCGTNLFELYCDIARWGGGCWGRCGCVRIIGFFSGMTGRSRDEHRFGTGGFDLPCNKRWEDIRPIFLNISVPKNVYLTRLSSAF